MNKDEHLESAVSELRYIAKTALSYIPTDQPDSFAQWVHDYAEGCAKAHEPSWLQREYEVLERAVRMAAESSHDGNLDAVTMAEVRACIAGIDAAAEGEREESTPVRIDAHGDVKLKMDDYEDLKRRADASDDTVRAWYEDPSRGPLSTSIGHLLRQGILVLRRG